MLSFQCDYNVGTHPAILQKLSEINFERINGYGVDPYVESARQKIRAACGLPEADVDFLVGGTQSNAVVIRNLLGPHQGVVAAETGHINVHEAGAIEYTGHKVLTLPAHDGKIDPAEFKAYMENFYGDDTYTHMVFPGMVYISYPTEFGTLYSKQELIELYAICKQYDMPLYIDGARLGYGLMSPAAGLTLPELARLCDVFTVGGTKVGTLFGEAVVFTSGKRPKHLTTCIKQQGAMLAKGWLLGVQFDVLFTDDRYFTISKNAIETAMQLKEGLLKKGYTLYLDSPTNQQFIILEDAAAERLGQSVQYSFFGKTDEHHTIVRLCTSWATTKEDINQLLAIL